MHLFDFALLLLTTIIVSVTPQNTPRTYVVCKDFFTGFKAGEFSVLDPTEKQRQYRIESRYSLFQSIEVFAYPSKQIIAKLKSKLKLFIYEATISIRDPRSHEWIDGKFKQTFQMLGINFTIEWNGQHVFMESQFGSLNTEFRDENRGKILAQYRPRILSMFWANKYDLQVFSNRLPDAIYFLGLAARDHIIARSSKSGKGKK